MNTLYVTVGNIGSGKSTWSRFFAGRQTNRIYILNADEIRTMLNGGVYDFNPEIECYIKDTLIALAADLISQGDVIIDGLNHTKKSRDDIFYKFIQRTLYRFNAVAVLFPPRKEHLERRIKEPRGYSADRWRGVFNEISASFEYPEVTEGFSEILTIDDVFEFMEMASLKRVK